MVKNTKGIVKSKKNINNNNKNKKIKRDIPKNNTKKVETTEAPRKKNRLHKKEADESNENNKDMDNNYDEATGNEADFYMDDADLLEDNDDNANGSDRERDEDGDDMGSDLDFGEDDYIESEDEEEDSEGKGKGKVVKEKKETKMTKSELSKILKKCMSGTPFALTKLIIIFAKITNPNQKIDSLDEDNALNKPKIIGKVIKFCIKNLPEILVLKYNTLTDSAVKNIIRRYLSALTRFLKNAESSMIALVFKYIENISSLVIGFKNFIDIFLKISIKTWASKGDTNTGIAAMKFVKFLIKNKPDIFELALKLFYLNYLEVAKATNIKSIKRIQNLQDHIISILSIDYDKAYLTIFTFIRKLCLQLRATISDKVIYIFNIEIYIDQIHIQLAVY